MRYFDAYSFECPRCGIQSEFGTNEFDPDNPTVTCPACEATWIVEEFCEGSWLDPIDEIS